MHHSRERARLTDVLKPANPRDRSLEAKSKARVHERPVLPKIQIPTVRVDRQLLLVNSMKEFVLVVFAL